MKAIKDVAFTDKHVWIHGSVKQFEGDRLEVDDGTGTLAVDIVRDGNADEGTSPTIVRGSLSPGATVRLVGDVAANTDRTFTLVPLVIQNLDELGMDKALFAKIRSLERQIAGD
ncbi:MAG: hypothetical protein JW839_19835 [Candidatus Lokiarchaeota archaeon]|nr:hypothetical protein [Candidatus Lokiarchaeota archaeon]